MSARRNEWIWLVLALAVFSIVSFWIILSSGSEEEIQPPYSTFTTQPRGCMALYELVQQAGFSVMQHGGTEYNLPANSCLVIVADSSLEMTNFMVMLLDTNALDLWVEQGGKLVLVADADTLLTSQLVSRMHDARLFEFDYQQSDAGLVLQVAEETTGGREGTETAISREYRAGRRFELARPRNLLWQSVEQIEIAAPDYAASRLDHVLLQELGTGQPVVMHEARGQGDVFWLTTPEIVTNLWLQRADNHRLVLSVISMAAADRPVYFFERIHGFSEQRHNVGSLLFRTRGGLLLIALGLCVALIFALHAVRPARSAPAPVPPRRHTAEMVFAQADLYMRAGRYNIAARRLIERLISQLTDRGQLAESSGPEALADLVSSGGPARITESAIISRFLAGGSLHSAKEIERLARECELILRRIETDKADISGR